jgi:uncharacterized membrane protein YdjX (TVP38/TMEM64 family)
VYGPLYGITYATLGSLVSAAFGYSVGRFFGTKFIRDDNALRHKIRHYLNRGELIGMTMIRFIPLAPFIVMNVAFGLLKIRFLTYMLATLLGLAPGIIAKAIFGDAIGKIWDHPDPVSISYLIAAVVSWILIIWGTHKLVSHFQQTNGKTHAA